MDWQTSATRLLLAVLLGGLIGLDREFRAKAGGLRTHMLVSLGAAVLVLIPQQLQLPRSDTAADISRIIQGIATGIGFVGAGEIVRQSSVAATAPRIRGLTSATAIWLTAAIGIATGCGLLALASLSTTLSLIVLVLAKQLEKLIPHQSE